MLLSLMESQDQLDPHIDFNWNDRIKMHRAVNLCVYLGDYRPGMEAATNFEVVSPLVEGGLLTGGEETYHEMSDSV